MSELEPSLDGRFREGLFYAGEGHVEPRRVLPELHARIEAAGGNIKFDSDADAEDLDGIVIDCRGLAARDEQPELRGVKGEMIIVETKEVELSRPVRLIHPRWPLYVIPRGDKHSCWARPRSRPRTPASASARRWNFWARPMPCIRPLPKRASSNSARAFVRPSRTICRGSRSATNKIAVNGLYRHGFLLAPALAELTLGYVQRGVIDNEVMQCV